MFAQSFGAVGAGENSAGSSFVADAQSSLAGTDGGLARAGAALRSNTLDTDGGTSGGATDGATAGAVGANSGPNVHVDWQRLAVKHAQREGKLILTKDGEPNMAMAFEELSAWFIKRLDDQGFGELRDQLVADFPEDKPPGELSTGTVEGTGHGTLTNAGGCGGGSSGVHIYVCEDFYNTRWNTPNTPRSVVRSAPGVMANDGDTYAGHTLTSWVNSFPLNGTLNLASDGGFTYTPDDGYIGADMFWYYVVDGFGGNASAPVTIYVYEPDVDVDSNNDGTIDDDNSQSGTDDKIEINAPGKLVPLNDDDDNGNGTPDNHANEVTPFVDNLGQPMNDDDLVEVELEMQFADKSFLKDRWLNLTFDYTVFRLWDTPDKQNEFVWAAQFPEQPQPPAPPVTLPYDNWWLLGTETVPASLWIEAVAPSAAVGDMVLAVDPNPQGAPFAEDRTFANVVSVNLDIGSGQGAGTVSDDDEFTVGAFTVANKNDTDGDGVIDKWDTNVLAAVTQMDGAVLPGDTSFLVQDVTNFAGGDTIFIGPFGATAESAGEFQKISTINVATKRINLVGSLVKAWINAEVKHRGRHEVDLMGLIIDPPNVTHSNFPNVRLNVDQGYVSLWDSPFKGTEIGLGGPDYLGGPRYLDIPVSLIPPAGLIIWVEAPLTSTAVRDIELSLHYAGASDKVSATAVWADESHNIHDNISYEQVTDIFPEITGTVIGDLIETFTRLGLVPIGGGLIGEIGVINAILMQFKVEPPGIELETNVNWDITRQNQYVNWNKLFSTDDWALSGSKDFPVHVELPNDDSIESEDFDETQSPDGGGHMYSLDAPGLVYRFTLGYSARRLKFNFREWMRVSFSGPPVGGDIVEGSRASDPFEWHARHDVVGDASGIVWERTTGDYPETSLNEVQPGAIYVFGAP